MMCVIMLCVIILSVVILGVIILSVMALEEVMLSVTPPHSPPGNLVCNTSTSACTVTGVKLFTGVNYLQ